MSSIATLTIDLIGKSGKLSAELKKATKNTQSWADKTRKLVGTSTKAMVGFGAAGVAAYASIYAKNAEFIDLQAKTADRLGITTQALGGLQHAANLYGATNEELTKSLQRMQQGLGQVAQTGTGESPPSKQLKSQVSELVDHFQHSATDIDGNNVSGATVPQA